MYICCICKLNQVETKINFGEQPISNRFLHNADNKEDKYFFILGYCHACGLVQLINPPADQEMKPLFDWITYSEPEAHLDQLAETISHLPGISSNSSIYGVSHFEDSLLARLKNKGFTKTWRFELDSDLGNCNSYAVINTIQRFLLHENIAQLTNERERPQVIIVRDMLEHAHDPLQFMQALRKIVRPDGYIIFEVPDYSKNFIENDFSSLWEEHISYFTPATFLNSLNLGGFTIRLTKNFSYPIQDYLIAVASPNQDSVKKINIKSLDREMQRVDDFVISYPKKCLWHQQVLSQYKMEGKIALLGAGHLACHFINLLQLEKLIDFVLDDNVNKCNMYMPGSKLPILPTKILENKNIKLCLLSVSQESENNIIQKKQTFLDRGGQFASIFSSSKIALMNLYKNKVGV